MSSYPESAARLVEHMAEAAKADPARAVSFQGAPGANSHRAAMEAAPDSLPLPCFSFEDALDAVTEGRAGRAIIPIENSQHGRVADIHFLLPESGLHIVGEHFLSIHHSLMAPKCVGARPAITAAYSHPQALGQSRFYLRERGIVPLSYADTAGAAAYVADLGDPTQAAIAPKIAAELYGLEAIEDNVEDAHDNTTRFVVLAREPLAKGSVTGPALTTFVFEVKNIPAALYKALGGFATNGVNMTKLESYMENGVFAATFFYAEVDGRPDDPGLKQAFEELAFYADHFELLGTYAADPYRLAQ
jgi:prephenate dehydratase